MQRGWKGGVVRIGLICLMGALAASPSFSQEGAGVEHPCLLADAGEIEKAKEWLEKYDWYKKILMDKKAEIDEFIERPVYVSPIKQEWAYEAYDCPECKKTLIFDEKKPFEHVCPKCRKAHKLHKHNATWAGRYNALLGHRMPWLGILYQVTGEEKYAKSAREILVKFADLYLKFPNKNNILGPARVFFATLGESIWGRNMAIGYDLVYNSPCFTEADRRNIKENLFYPLVEIVQQFPETVSNRQAFYDVCVAAIGFLYGDKRLIDIAVEGPLGFKYLLRVGMSKDGFWSEGPGYHFATLHNFLFFAEMARHHGIDYYRMETAGHCLKKMFDAPFELVSPDYEFPRMRDSGGGSLLKYVGYYEAAYARYGDRRYAEMINFTHRRKGTGRKPMIFFALNPELPETKGDIYVDRSSHFEETGFCMLRDEVGGDRKFLYLDYGIVGGEHGHPDRLSIGYYALGSHWLVDPRNESYALPNLQTWYRQTVAHDTIVVDESKQAWTNGYNRFFGETPGLKVASGSADHLYGGVKLTRTILLAGDYFIDLFDASAAEPRTYDLPYHSFGALSVEGVDLEKQPKDLFGHPPGVQGYDQFTEIEKADTDGSWKASFCREDGKGLSLLALGVSGTVVFRAMTPGKSDDYDKRLPMVMIRRRAEATRFACLLEAFDGDARVKRFDRAGDGSSFTVTVGEEVHTLAVDVERARYSAIRKKSGRVVQVSSFNLKSVTDAGRKILSADFALPFFDVRYEGDKAFVTAPQDFGGLGIYGPKLQTIVVNGRKVPFARDGKVCFLRQERRGLVAKRLAPESGKIFLGLNNTVRLEVHNYFPIDIEVEVGLRLQDRWEEDIRVQQEYWGGIVNLVATNKTDVRKVLLPERPARLTSDWVNSAPARVKRIPRNGCMTFEFVLAPKNTAVLPGRYEIVPVFRVSRDEEFGARGEPFTLDLLEPVTADLILPNGRRNALAVTLQNNTTESRRVSVEISPSEWWKIEGEPKAELEVPAGGTFVHEVSGRLVGYRPEEQLYPVDLSVKSGDFAVTIRKDFYVGICHWADNPPSLTSFEGWNRSTPMMIDKKNQLCRLLFGTQPWGGLEDLSARIHAMFDEKYLYVGTEVWDGRIVDHCDPRMRYPSDTDCIEIIMDTRTDSAQGRDPPTEGVFRHLAIAEYREIRFDSSTPADIPIFFRQIAGAKTFYRRTDKGYDMIVRIPFAGIPLMAPKDGFKVGFDLAISDNDGALYRKNEHIWAGYNQNQNWLDLRLIGALVCKREE